MESLGINHYKLVFRLLQFITTMPFFTVPPTIEIISLNPENGSVNWAHDPQVDLSKFGVPRCRGVSSWTNPKLNETSKCKHMIFAPTMDARIIALDATDGEKCH